MKCSASLALLALLCVACGGSSNSVDAAADGALPEATPGNDVLTQSEGSVPVDASQGEEASVPGDAACSASDAGAVQMNYYCDLASIHVLQNDGAPARVQVAGRVGVGGSACGVVDSVELLNGGTVVQRLSSMRSFQPGNPGELLAEGDADATLTARCAEETTRLSSYGLVVRGRDARGPFEARCGVAASGSRWPPATFLACHRNVEQVPLTSQASNFSLMSLGSHYTTTGYFSLPHPASRPTFTSVQAVVRVVSPQDAPFSSSAPLMSRDTSGWGVNVSEGSTGGSAFTTVNLNALDMNPLGAALCPPPGMPPNPPASQPFFLARLQGTSARGAVSVEVLANCTGTLGL